MNLYDGDYRKLMVLPIILVAVSLFFIPQVNLGIDFQGGTIITLYTDTEADIESLEQSLYSKGLTPQSLEQFDTQIGHVIEIQLEEDKTLSSAEQLKGEFHITFDRYSWLESVLNSPTTSNTTQKYIDEYNTFKIKYTKIMADIFELSQTPEQEYETANEMKKEFTNSYNKIKKDYQTRVEKGINIEYDSITVKSVSPSLGLKFIERAVTAAIWAIILAMALSFAVFRKISTSIIVFSGALADIIICLGAMGFFGIELTMSSFAALLMMLGFSLDTDMLLTMRLIKQRRGTLREAAWSALHTGGTMSVTDLIAFTVLLVVGYFTHLTTYFEIASVAVIGLIGDIIATWMFNAPLIMMMLKEK